MAFRFTKMHGAGNDFVIVDRRHQPVALPAELVALIADRHRGVGFDQLITIDPPRGVNSVAAYSIFNADGSMAAQCGNGARCVAAWLLRDGIAVAGNFTLDGPVGPVIAQRLADNEIGIDMGVPNFEPSAIGLSLKAQPLYRLAYETDEILFGAVSMGNPHVVIEVDDVMSASVETWGQFLQQQSIFSDSCNVGFAQVVSEDAIRLRVFERGVGETLACGSGACAAMAVLARRGRVGSQVSVTLPGGVLNLHWAGEGKAMHMAGPAAFVFEGEFLS